MRLFFLFQCSRVFCGVIECYGAFIPKSRIHTEIPYLYHSFSGRPSNTAQNEGARISAHASCDAESLTVTRVDFGLHGAFCGRSDLHREH
jgi:hypothetical protein